MVVVVAYVVAFGAFKLGDLVFGGHRVEARLGLQ